MRHRFPGSTLFRDPEFDKIKCRRASPFNTLAMCRQSQRRNMGVIISGHQFAFFHFFKENAVSHTFHQFKIVLKSCKLQQQSWCL